MHSAVVSSYVLCIYLVSHCALGSRLRRSASHSSDNVGRTDEACGSISCAKSAAQTRFMQFSSSDMLSKNVDLSGAFPKSRGPTALRESVAPLLGTGGHGHTFPGATTPWGMVQATPWTHSLDGKVSNWDTQSGYHEDEGEGGFYGMAHSALSGAGSGEMGELRIRPRVYNTSRLVPTLNTDSVVAFPGFFSAHIEDASESSDGMSEVFSESSIFTESSATPRGALHRFTFSPGVPRAVEVLLSDVPHSFYGAKLIDHEHRVVSDRVYEGCANTKNDGIGGANSLLCFVIEFDQPFQTTSLGLHASDLTFHFASTQNSSTRISAFVGISRTSVAGARDALKAELHGKSFDVVVQEAQQLWENALSVVRIKDTQHGGKYQRMFYTAMYHSMISPNLLSDVDGSYRLQQKDNKEPLPHSGRDISLSTLDEVMPVRQSPAGENMYSTFSLWDTYRSLHPLMDLVHPRQSTQFGHSLMAMQAEWGYLPPWQLLQSPTDMMEGDGGTITLVTMARLGIVDKDATFNGVSAGRRHAEFDVVDLYEKGKEAKRHGVVSNILENSRADSCVAALARDLNKPEEANFFQHRANRVLELWNPEQYIFSPFKSKLEMLEDGFAGGSSPESDILEQHVLKTKLNILDQNDAFAEGSPFQYSWGHEWDIEKMATLRGGDVGFACKLDEFFESTPSAKGQADMSGNIGGASMGNEPVMHTPYLYSLIGHPERTQYMVNKIVKQVFSYRWDGLPGNDDLGQVSSWLAFSMLGLYPVNPCSGEYALGRPFVEEADMKVAGGLLQIRVKNQSDANMYVERLSWNGQELDVAFPHLTFDKLSRGGTLEFTMAAHSPRPSYTCPTMAPVKVDEVKSRTHTKADVQTEWGSKEFAKLSSTRDDEVKSDEVESHPPAKADIQTNWARNEWDRLFR